MAEPCGLGLGPSSLWGLPCALGMFTEVALLGCDSQISPKALPTVMPVCAHVCMYVCVCTCAHVHVRAHTCKIIPGGQRIAWMWKMVPVFTPFETVSLRSSSCHCVAQVGHTLSNPPSSASTCWDCRCASLHPIVYFCAARSLSTQPHPVTWEQWLPSPGALHPGSHLLLQLVMPRL